LTHSCLMFLHFALIRMKDTSEKTERGYLFWCLELVGAIGISVWMAWDAWTEGGALNSEP
jgi:hypothetical protein